VISGTVTEGDTGRPLRRVRISLEDDSRSLIAADAVTDEQGRFMLNRLRAGTYTLKAARSGFLDVTYGQRKPGSGRAGTPIPLAEGQRVEKLALTMPRGGVISGVVTDEVGDRVSGVPIRPLRAVWRNGVREWQSIATTASVVTDDRGQYRAFGLAPGDYVICAAPRDDILQAAMLAESLRRRMEEMQAAAARGTQTPEQKAMTDRMSTNAVPEAPKQAYVPVCAPGSTQLSAAAPVSLDVGEERAGVDVQLQLVPIARVSGTVTWSGGKLPVGNTAEDTLVALTTPDAIPGGASYAMHVPANGQFSIMNVSPGTYTLRAHAAAPRVAGSGSMLWASTEIVVSGQPISDVVLSLDTGVTISGRVVADGTAPVDITKMRIMASHGGSIQADLAPVLASPDASGRFALVGVVPGRYRIIAYPGSPGVNNIRSSVANGRDTLDFPLEVRMGEPVTDVVVTVVPRLAEIAGQLQHEANRPATGFTVIVFPVDQQYWTPQARRIQAVRPAIDGRFSFRNLPGGEYGLVAVTDVESGQWFDPAFLKELLTGSIGVTLAEGERKEQTLRVVIK
ncbi:MAG TPA: carboxypeptidase regulatory-like domain-containing protein, partial [Vicinamibacterales bacterium]|nr:carboxypeptidase regulatory-like domain-containing protein [Vicinamibacterales bacterium]